MKTLNYHDWFNVAIILGERELSIRVAAKTAKQAEKIVYELNTGCRILTISQEIKHKGV